MKKLIFILSLFFTCILITNAAPCKVISGDGTNIGDEIQCGTENFYVLSNDGEEIRMLAKYNLNVGRTYYKIEFTENFETYSEAYDYYYDNYYEQYPGISSWLENDNGTYYGAIVYKNIEYNEVLQSEEAIGAHGDESGNPVFPEVGIVYFYVEGIDANYTGEAVPFLDFSADKIRELKDTDTQLYLNEYYNLLNNRGVQIEEISILSITDLNDITYNITGEHLPLEDWYNEKEQLDENDIREFRLGSIKEIIPSKYEWLWSTTYWLRTLSIQKESNKYRMSHYYVDTLGDICAKEYCPYSIGAGIRPVVTIPAYLIYNIETKTDGNGTVEADHVEAESGTIVKFTVTPKEGYVLSEVKVTDANGNIVIFTDYTFTMPNANVLIEATFKPIPVENPTTKTFIGSFIIITLVVSLFLFIINNRKINEN